MSKIVQNSQPATLEELLIDETLEMPAAPILQDWQEPESLLDVHPYTAVALMAVTLATILFAACFLAPLPPEGAWTQMVGRVCAALAAFFFTAFVGELVASHAASADAAQIMEDEVSEL